MKFISDSKLIISLVMICITLNSIVSKANLRSRAFEPASYTKKELEYVKDFDDFSEKIEHVQNTNYMDILKLGAGIKNPNINMKSNVQKSNPYRFVQKNTIKARSHSMQDSSDEAIPLADLQNSSSAQNYKGDASQRYPPGTIPQGLARYLV